ncbi:asparagine synthase (glutamine-hydrolyzing) [Photorhabdus hainanensis]|uniref:asparagine synthase (glutamine-hydrolyzing) n=1 Tax=Photorhabdus hainanensis TaxID=1004166 RepID=UPI001BD452F8|nr:asparagine synthase (glutamine-hydrolyzing) [Photorhabdus hainanensis]MBS9433147.1 asparagine synthase (glutamine-hydrolyzing) [Photorhabdus hainanensis]
MCGIGGIFNTENRLIDDIENKLHTIMSKIAHRGDSSRFNEKVVRNNFAIATNRLAIVERDSAYQPISNQEHDLHLVLNGQIYNYKSLRNELIKQGYQFKNGGDAEVTLIAYICYGKSFIKKLDGMFSFILFDNKNNKFLLGRDHVGIKPLYYTQKEGNWYVASEIKSLIEFNSEIKPVEPGSIFDGFTSEKYISYDTNIFASNDNFERAKEKVYSLLDNAVKKRVDTDLPISIMFSGGIDSTIVLYLAHKYHHDVTAISFGLPGSKDIEIAQRYCSENKIKHIIYTFTQEELINNIQDAIYYGEFFEQIDAIDSNIAHFGYYIANRLGFKIALCGEGSDEIFAGYDLFKTYPDPHYLSLYRLNNLHRTDLQRVDRASMRNTVEARVPFMDSALVPYVLSLDFSYKLNNGVEKYILREAFRGKIPEYIIDRPKIRMPDGSGVKNTIIDYIKDIKCDLPKSVVDNLNTIGLTNQSALYFAEKYLSLGYPLPKERFKESGKDFSESGYFNFIS